MGMGEPSSQLNDGSSAAAEAPAARARKFLRFISSKLVIPSLVASLQILMLPIKHVEYQKGTFELRGANYL
jgi:hypothetical protein